jgi:2-polyprenyl-3-methyl-5-hydroxy-6-metoxy-1,4-benzoquinol methylase
MQTEQTREPQYQRQVQLRDTTGQARLGLTTNHMWQDDPRHLLFALARYKFVSKMLSGKRKVLEVGCGDAFGTRLVQQEVGSVWAVDFDPVFVRDVESRMDDRWRLRCQVHDMLSGPVEGDFDAAYSLDVIEHIRPVDEDCFLTNIVRSLRPHGVLIIGTPSLNSQAYASQYSKAGHINCKNHQQIKDLMAKHFHNVFLFSMNDEVVHTGFYPMAHYFLAMCVAPRSESA